jgi:hypothetical protein
MKSGKNVSKPAPGVFGKTVNHLSNKSSSQETSPPPMTSAKQNTAVGSGSRPTSNRFKIESSNPTSSQKIRPSNPPTGTSYKG